MNYGPYAMIRYIKELAKVIGRIVATFEAAVDIETRALIRREYNRLLCALVGLVAHLSVLVLFLLAVAVDYLLAHGILVLFDWPGWAILMLEVFGVLKILWLLK